MLNGGQPREFLTTQWGLVATAGRSAAPDAAAALESLCKAYWQPLYAQVRRRGFSPDDAADLIQAFFQRIIERNVIQYADQNRGRFRTFLLTALSNFVSDEHDRTTAVKRGGRMEHLRIDAAEGEEFYAQELTVDGPAETEFDRAWARAILDRVRQRLRAEAVTNGRVALFDALLPTENSSPEPYEQVGQSLGMSEGAVKLAAFRLRQQYRDVIREEVSQTVANPKELDEELRYLLEVIAARAAA